jgi:hypothetical protein
MEQSSWESNSCSLSQEIPHILWDMKVCYHVYKSLSQINSVYIHHTSLRSIWILSLNLFRYAFNFSPMHATCHPSYSPWIDFLDNVWWGVQIMTLFVELNLHVTKCHFAECVPFRFYASNVFSYAFCHLLPCFQPITVAYTRLHATPQTEN